MYLVRAREFELVRHSSVFFDDFERPDSLVVEFFAGSVRFEIPGIEPYLVPDFEVIWSSASVVEPLHVFCRHLEGGFRFFEYSGHFCYEVSRSFLSFP